MLKKAMLLLVCSLLIAALPAGYAYAETESGASATEQRLEAAAEGGALAGWQCYSCGEDGERRAAPCPYSSPKRTIPMFATTS